MDLHKRTEPGPRTPADPRASDLRASDADRDRFADVLREALAEGRLTPEEHAERVEEVYRAKTVGELEPLVRDLPGAHRRRLEGVYAPPSARPAAGAVPLEPDDNVVAVFSAAVRRGRRRVGRRTHVYAVFGSVELDLSEALFEYQHVMIKVFSIFGDVQIRVPENVSLHGDGGGVLGAFEITSLESAEPDAPVVRVDGLAVLGSVTAKPKRGRLIEDLRDRVQDLVHDRLRKHLGR